MKYLVVFNKNDDERNDLHLSQKLLNHINQTFHHYYFIKWNITTIELQQLQHLATTISARNIHNLWESLYSTFVCICLTVYFS